MKHNVRDAKGRFCRKALVEAVTGGYKGFRKNLICRDKQYKVGETYEERGNTICAPGMMHFCENPSDVLNFYPAIDPKTGELNEFAKVKAIGRVIKSSNKSATNKLRIVRKLNLRELITDAETEDGVHVATTEYASGAATAGDYYNAITAARGSSAATAGKYSNAVTAGNESNATAIGKFSHAATAGESSYATTTGNYSNAVTAGKDSHAATVGYGSHAITVGPFSHATVSGIYSIAAALGIGAKAKADLGGWIVLAEYNLNNAPICIKAASVDGEKIKANTFYRLKDGEFVECEEW